MRGGGEVEYEIMGVSASFGIEIELKETSMNYATTFQNKQARPQEKGSATCLAEAINESKVAAGGGEIGEQINLQIAGVLPGIASVAAAAVAVSSLVAGEQTQIEAEVWVLKMGATVIVHSL